MKLQKALQSAIGADIEPVEDDTDCLVVFDQHISAQAAAALSFDTVTRRHAVVVARAPAGDPSYFAPLLSLTFRQPCLEWTT
jgi:hypothetical protein